MKRTVAIGVQNYAQIIENDYYYIDKTHFIKEWWESGDSVTLITRPRRFGKTLTLNMTEQFFSIKYAGREDLFIGMDIWKEEKFRALQGTYPVISLSFANIKETNYENAREKICRILSNIYAQYEFILDSEIFSNRDRVLFKRISETMSDVDATLALYQLSDFLYRYYRKKVIILLDEYDTPMQEAYVYGFWDELSAFTRSLFHSAFKTNPWLERAIMTGITRVSKESIFSDLNNLKVITTTSDEYADCFGFTEKEVFAAIDECGLTDKEQVKKWYDGFVFGSKKDIYNPWSIINYLDTGKIGTYWANTSANDLISKLIQEGSPDIKIAMEGLLKGEHLYAQIDEQIAYNQLDTNETAVWSLLLASGYLKADSYIFNTDKRCGEYELSLTNLEVQCMFERLIDCWFSDFTPAYNNFVKALLLCDTKAMNHYMNRVTLSTFSYFDTGKEPSFTEPERFYHGFVLGLMVDLKDRYIITSNRESGFRRYNVMLEPLKTGDNAYILEFKVHDPDSEQGLKGTVDAALKQIEEKQYEIILLEKKIPKEKIKKYGFAFEGKNVMIG